MILTYFYVVFVQTIYISFFYHYQTTLDKLYMMSKVANKSLSRFGNGSMDPKLGENRDGKDTRLHSMLSGLNMSCVELFENF